MEGNPLGTIRDVACDLRGIHQVIAALHLSAENMHDQRDAMRLLEWLVSAKVDDLETAADVLQAELRQPALAVRCVPRG